MKNSILKISLGALIAFSSQVSSAQEDKKSKHARKDVAEANENLKVASTDSIKERKQYKDKAQLKNEEYKIKIAALKAKSENTNKELKEKYDKRVASLEQKNNKLSKELAESENNKTGKWESFKREINHDMDELGKAIDDLGNDNVK